MFSERFPDRHVGDARWKPRRPTFGHVKTRTRFVGLDGCVNFRDLGGYDTHDGFTLPGVIYRSDSLHRLTDEDLTRVDDLGISTVIDLRTPEEAAPAPARVPTGATLWAIPTIDSTMNAPMTRPELATIVDGYAAVLRESLPQQAAALAAIADADGAVVFCCTAGKDRTGLLAALTLGLVGADDDVIAADYALSAEVIDLVKAQIVAEDPERASRWMTAAPDVMSATTDTMVSTLARLRSRWGGFAGYAAAAGLEADTIDRLRTKLVHSL